MPIFIYLTFRCNLIKIPKIFHTSQENIVLKSYDIRDSEYQKQSWIKKKKNKSKIVGITFLELKLYCNTAVTETGRYWHKNRYE